MPLDGCAVVLSQVRVRSVSDEGIVSDCSKGRVAPKVQRLFDGLSHGIVPITTITFYEECLLSDSENATSLEKPNDQTESFLRSIST